MNNDHTVQTYHEVDQATGMVQTTGNYATAFTPDRKEQFLSVYVASGLRFKHTCKQLGISDHTVHHHVSIDPEFKKRLEDAQAEYAEDLEADQRNFARDKKNFMDRAMQLRYLFPKKYARDEKSTTNQPIQININGNLLIDAKSREEMIEARVVKSIEAEQA